MRFELFGIRFSISTPEDRAARQMKIKSAAPPKGEAEASDEFWRAFSFGGTLVSTCQCGRTHFCLNTDLDYNEGELEKLLKKSEAEPDRYLCNSVDNSIAVMDLHGGIVWGCPCRMAARYEAVFLQNRLQILEFYRLIQQRERCDVALVDEALAAAQGDHKREMPIPQQGQAEPPDGGAASNTSARSEGQ